MRLRVDYHGLQYDTISGLRQETGDAPFRIAGAEPFFFQNVNSDTQILFRSSRGPQNLGTVSTMTGTIEVDFEDGVSAFVRDHVKRICPAIGDALIAVRNARRERKNDLFADALVAVGPKESNKKVGILKTSGPAFMSMAVFGNLLSDTLPRPLKITGIDRTSQGYFDMQISAVEDKGVRAHVLNLRYANGRMETTSEFEDQKGRPEFFDFIYDTMRFRRQQFLDNPVLQRNLAMLAARENDLSRVIVRENASNRPWMPYRFQLGDENRIVAKDQFNQTGMDERVIMTPVPLTPELSVIIRSFMGSSCVFAVAFQDQPLMMDWGGGMPGLEHTREIWALAKSIAIQTRPDLLTREAHVYDVKMATAIDVEAKIDLETELKAALTHADAHTPALEI